MRYLQISFWKYSELLTSLKQIQSVISSLDVYIETEQFFFEFILKKRKENPEFLELIDNLHFGCCHRTELNDLIISLKFYQIHLNFFNHFRNNFCINYLTSDPFFSFDLNSFLNFQEENRALQNIFKDISEISISYVETELSNKTGIFSQLFEIDPDFLFLELSSNADLILTKDGECYWKCYERYPSEEPETLLIKFKYPILLTGFKIEFFSYSRLTVKGYPFNALLSHQYFSFDSKEEEINLGEFFDGRGGIIECESPFLCSKIQIEFGNINSHYSFLKNIDFYGKVITENGINFILPDPLFEVDTSSNTGIYHMLHESNSDSLRVFRYYWSSEYEDFNQNDIDNNDFIFEFENESIEFQFPSPVLLRGYLLRSQGEKYPRFWELLGSNDHWKWILIDQHKYDHTIREPFTSYKFGCFFFQPFQFIRVRSSCSSLSLIEFFGKFFPEMSMKK